MSEDEQNQTVEAVVEESGHMEPAVSPVIELNRRGLSWGRRRIKAGHFDDVPSYAESPMGRKALSATADDSGPAGNYYLGKRADEAGKLEYSLPFAVHIEDRLKVSRSALRAIRHMAEMEGDIHEAASELLELLERKAGRVAPDTVRRGYTGPIEQRNEQVENEQGVALFPAEAELRAEDGDNGPLLVGYAAVWDTLSVEMWWGYEKIQRGAFAASLARGDDVIACLEHEGGLAVLARTVNGTLKLEEDDIGLRVEIHPASTQTGTDTIELVRRGDLYQMSFQFRVVKQELDDSGEDTIRTLIQVDLFDVAIVSRPAYPATSVELKSAEDQHERRRHELDELDHVARSDTIELVGVGVRM